MSSVQDDPPEPQQAPEPPSAGRIESSDTVIHGAGNRSPTQQNPTRRRNRTPLLMGPPAAEELEQARVELRDGNYEAGRRRLENVLARPTWALGARDRSRSGASIPARGWSGGLANAAASAIGSSWRRDEASARSLLGVALEHLDERADALEQYRRAVDLLSDLPPENLTPVERSDLGIALVGLGRSAEALHALRVAANMEGATPEAHLALGVLLSERGELVEARHHLLTACMSVPSNGVGWLALAEVLERLDDDDAPAAYAEAGSALFSMGSVDERAVDAFDKAVALGLEDAEILALRGESLRLLGRLDEALDSLNRALQLDPGLVYARISIALVFDSKGYRDKALARLSDVLNDYPEQAVALGLRGMILASEQRIDEARRDLDRALAIDPSLTWARVELAETLRLADRPEEAVAAADLALEQTPDDLRLLTTKGAALLTLDRLEEALAATESALAQAADNPFALALKGEILSEQGRFGDAYDTLTRALDLDDTLAWARQALAETLRQLGRLQEAAATAEELLASDRRDVRALGTKGAALAALGDAAGALAALDRAIELDENYLFGLTVKADVLIAEGRVDEAVACLRRALELQPDEPAAVGSAVKLADHGEPARALELLEQSASAKSAVVLTARGKILRQLGLFEEANELLYQALRLAPNNLDILETSGYVLTDLQRYAEAIATFERAVEISRSSSTLADLAFTLQRAAEYDRAIAAADEAVRLDGENVWARLTRGDIRLDIGEFEPAVEDLQAVTQRHRDNAAFTSLGWAFQNLERPEDALDAFAAAHEIDEQDLWARKGLGNALLALGQEGAARDHFERVIADAEASKGADVDVLSLTAWCLYRLERFDDAILLLRRSVSARADVADHFDMALALLGSGQEAAAVDEYRRAFEHRDKAHPLRWRGYVHVAWVDLRDLLGTHMELQSPSVAEVLQEMTTTIQGPATTTRP